MPTKGINLNDMGDRVLTQRNAAWWRVWGNPTKFPINPSDNDPQDYTPSDFLP